MRPPHKISHRAAQWPGTRKPDCLFKKDPPAARPVAQRHWPRTRSRSSDPGRHEADVQKLQDRVRRHAGQRRLEASKRARGDTVTAYERAIRTRSRRGLSVEALREMNLRGGRAGNYLVLNPVPILPVQPSFIARLLGRPGLARHWSNHSGLRRSRSREGSPVPNRGASLFIFSRCLVKRCRRSCLEANRRQASCSRPVGAACREGLLPGDPLLQAVSFLSLPMACWAFVSLCIRHSFVVRENPREGLEFRASRSETFLKRKDHSRRDLAGS